MKYVVLACLALAFGFAFSLPADAAGARVNAFDRVFGPVHCSTRGVCVVTENGGGVIDDFKTAARAVNKSSLMVVIAGPCYSACTIFADKARTHVCITPNAEFGFHQASLSLIGRNGEIVGSEPDFLQPLPGNSSDIAKWVKAHGGYPSPEKLLVMPYAQALQFWNKCSSGKT